MISIKSFCDLSVRETNIDNLQKMCEMYIELGYKVIAVNQVLSETEFKFKKSNKGKSGKVESPTGLTACVELGTLRQMFQGKLKILNRLTFSFSDHLTAHLILKDPNVKHFDLIAAIPETQAAYQQLCVHINVDIISFDPENNYPIKLSRRLYNTAVRRGLCFELMYVPAIFGSALRQTIISRGHTYYYFGKSKNILLSSNASCPFHIKGPYDVINIGLLLGLSEEYSKYAITGVAKNTITHAECRKLGKAAPILIESIKHKTDAQDSEDVLLHKKQRCA